MEDEIVESASVAMLIMEKGCYDFVVKNYSIHKGIGVGEAIESDEFTVGGHRWKVWLYPNGKIIESYNAGNASLFISLVSEAPPYRYIHCLYDMHIIDQSGKGNHRGISSIKSDGPVDFLRKDQFSGYNHFTKQATLESQDYLKDDCLKIRCTIGVLTRLVQNLPVIEVPKSNIGAKLLKSKLGADISFKVENEIFWAHKWILAAHSPLFRTALSDCHRSEEIVVPHMEPSIFKAMLWFIYTGCLPEEDEEAISDSSHRFLELFMEKMLVAADRFELKLLKRLCESRISETISKESVAYLLDLADRCHATELKVACRRFSAENEVAVLKSHGYEDLMKYCPSVFLKLAGSKKDSSYGGGELSSCGKGLFVAEDSPFGMFWPWSASHTKDKLKEV
ncbi:hypothetical protein ACP275_09G002900 [Erythranthe tilingii]